MIVRKGLSKQQEKDAYMWEARNIQNIALSIVSDPSFVIKNIDNVTARVLTELKYILDSFAAAEVDQPVHSVLRTRTEYLLLVINAIFQESSDDVVNSVAELVLVMLFDLAASLEEVLMADTFNRTMGGHGHVAKSEKFTSVTDSFDEQNLPAGRTQWSDMSLTAVSLLTVRILRRLPSLRAKLNISMAECIAASNNPDVCWQRQYLSLGLIHTSLLFETSTSNYDTFSAGLNKDQLAQNNNGGKIRASSSNTIAQQAKSTKLLSSSTQLDLGSSAKLNSVVATPTAASTASSKLTKRRSRMSQVTSFDDNNLAGPDSDFLGSGSAKINGAAPNKLGYGASSSSRGRSSLKLLSLVDEMCKSGFVRTVAWMLLHCQHAVRMLAAEVRSSHFLTHSRK